MLDCFSVTSAFKSGAGPCDEPLYASIPGDGITRRGSTVFFFSFFLAIDSMELIMINKEGMPFESIRKSTVARQQSK